ncbi:MAG: SDR family oxidoreductase [Chloroflexaceae bacterium]|nr:SDR family oxidoreductase [Chloroflexaceae bacterium]
MSLFNTTTGWLTSALAAGSAIALAGRTLREIGKLPLRDRVVIITGGSRGLGLVLAHAFGQRGACLALLARNPQELEHAAEELRAANIPVLPLVCDVRDQKTVQQSIEQVIMHYGRIDVLVNNAGVIQVGPLDHMSTEDFEQAMAVHFWGPLYTTQAALPYLRSRGGGRIVNISSIGGLVAVPHLLPYSASKFALSGLSDGLRAELASDNIRVTSVYPGLMRTGSHLNALFKGQHEAEFAWFAISNAMPFLSTDAPTAARQIVEACQRGDPQLIITPQANLLHLTQTLMPIFCIGN